MAKNQRSYTQEFKQQIVDLHNQAGKGISELSREYGIPKGTISTWIKNLSPVQVSETETISMKEYKALQKKMKELEIENEILKKATAIFAKNQYKKNQGVVPDDKENILNRDFSADTVFKKLVTDIPYIHVVNEGWTYLASVMDLYDRTPTYQKARW